MGKIGRILSSGIAFIFLCTFLILPGIIRDEPANAGGSGTPWCDRYGFVYPSGLDTWFGQPSTYGGSYTYGLRHSGIYEYWEANNPSVHWSICNHAPAWQGSCYFNKQFNYPYTYLSGNGMFIFAGYGERHCILFSNGSSYTYIYDHTNNIPFGRIATSSAISSTHYKMDYMKLAFLAACNTTDGTDGHLAY